VRALDLFCGTGGATKGLQRAGFHVTGVDVKAQPRYCGDEFHQADALAFPLDGFDFIWASPPCQRYSITRKIHDSGDRHPDLVEPIRARLVASGVPYVIENVPGAPLKQPFVLCGSMFGLQVYRHRLFEASFLVLAPPHQSHSGYTNAARAYSSFKDGATVICVAGNNFRREDGALAMGIDWPMTRPELAQSSPPAYAQFIAEAALAHIEHLRAAA
jgi:DNA (cytosine-5)-methyltransferase 1